MQVIEKQKDALISKVIEVLQKSSINQSYFDDIEFRIENGAVIINSYRCLAVAFYGTHLELSAAPIDGTRMFFLFSRSFSLQEID